MKKRIIIGIVIALVLCVLLWRFIPRSAENLMSVDESKVISFAAISMTGRNLAGEPNFSIYRIDSADATQENIKEMWEILKTSAYQPDFRNLLPWGIDSVSADRNYDSRTVTVQFSYGDDYIDITFHTPTMITVNTKDGPAFRVYHPTNQDTLTKLVAYMEENGRLQETEE